MSATKSVLLKGYSSLRKNEKDLENIWHKKWHWKSEFCNFHSSEVVQSNWYQKNIGAKFTHVLSCVGRSLWIITSLATLANGRNFLNYDIKANLR
jgi:hypothetical protein